MREHRRAFVEPVKRTGRGSGYTRGGFTLVELLVVVAIIALLLGILLPALGKARDVARSTLCLSNQRQMGAASMVFANEHDNYVQISTSDLVWNRNVPKSTRYDFFPNELGTSQPVLKDWASALVPYLGGKPDQTFDDDDFDGSGVYRCPSDPHMDDEDPGYKIYNNISDGPSDNKAVSFAVNADLTSVNFGTFAKWTPDQALSPAGANRLAAEGNLGRVFAPSDTLLHMDMGTRVSASGKPVNNSEILMVTGSYWVTDAQNNTLDGTLGAIEAANWTIRDKLPVDAVSEVESRHGNNINVVFTDGHAASTGEDDWPTVRISPNRF